MMSTFMAYSPLYSQPVVQPYNVYPASHVNAFHAHRSALPNSDVMQDHRGRRSQVVFRNIYRAPAIHFFSSREDDDGVGVAFPKCIEFYETDVQNSNRSIQDVLPPHMHATLFTPQRPHYLHIHWKGYKHLQWKHEIAFRDIRNKPYTVGEMAYQIASIWQRFIDEHCNDFKGPGIRLGPLFVSTKILRLHEIYCRSEYHWQAEVSFPLP